MRPDHGAIDRLLSRLAKDVATTIGAEHRALIDHAASLALELDVDDPATKIVENVQQAIHDTFLDVTWPHARTTNAIR